LRFVVALKTISALIVSLTFLGTLNFDLELGGLLDLINVLIVSMGSSSFLTP
jgi:hypothetical protein